MKFENLKEKCLYYRGLTDYKIMPNSNILAMVDGRAFSKFVKHRFNLPFDQDFINMMNETAKYLCQNIQGCKFAYVQSDEISLLITDYDTPETDIFFGGRLCKMQSIIASLATAKFNQLLALYEIDNENVDSRTAVEDMDLIQFDAKVWNVPNSNDVYAWFLYRQLDCMRNSKQQAAQAYFSHKQLVGKDCDKQIEMLKDEKGIDWYTYYNDGEKFGRFVYPTIKHMTKTLLNGDTIEFDRNMFDAHYGFMLSENKEKFFEIIPILNKQ